MLTVKLWRASLGAFTGEAGTEAGVRAARRPE